MIEVRELTKTYGGPAAVDGLTFAAPAGKVTGFLGPNGAGKTTTFRCLLGLARPDSGTALIGGRRYADLAAPRRTVGARAAGLDPGRIDPALELVGLAGAADRRVGGWSLGMRQRLGIAAATLGDPAVLVLDEPANGLDPEGVRWVREVLRRWADDGRTVVVSSHQLAEVSQVVDRVVIIRDGRLVAESDIADLAAGRVTVRVDRTDALLATLGAAGVAHERLDDGTIAVAGRDPAEVGALAARAGVTVTELGRSAAGEALEALFLDLTGDAGGRGR